MSIESTVFILDNSDWARNGDYFPNRWDCQLNSLQLMVEHKGSNPENSMGLILLGGKQVELLLTPVQNQVDKLLGLTHNVKLGGTPKFVQALSISNLVLKHRKDKIHKARIVVFVSSPIPEDEKQLITLAKKLKKNSIAIDLILLGEHNQALRNRLKKFIETVSSGGNSSFIPIDQGIDPTEFIFNFLTSFGTSVDNNEANSPAVAAGGATAATGAAGAPASGPGSAGYAGQDYNALYNQDPELALALRMSMEESKNNQNSPVAPAGENKEAANSAKKEEVKDQKMNIEVPKTPGNEKEAASVNKDTADKNSGVKESTEEQILALALKLSLEADENIQEEQPLIDQKQEQDLYNDPDFMQELLDEVEKENQKEEENEKDKQDAADKDKQN